jgi:hypothetical protein
MNPTEPGHKEYWHKKILRPRLPWDAHPIRPAEITSELRSVMLSRENILEDAVYTKIVPNRYLVEVSPHNYTRNYQPIDEQIIQQWREELLEHLTTTNSRMGRKEYRFGGPVQIEIRPAPDLYDTQARILSRVSPEENLGKPPQRELPACLVMVPGGNRWRLRPGTTTIGRDPGCDISLDIPIVHERRLISGTHAHIQAENGLYRLFDGSPDGKTSLNGTYASYRRVPGGGTLLQDGEIIILAALDPNHPLPDTPGVVTFHFRLDCKA